MRIITEKQVRLWIAKQPGVGLWLQAWMQTVKHANWTSLPEVRRTYSHADSVRVASGKTVTVFNVSGNDYRLIIAIHYASGLVFTLMLLTHAEYSKGQWKKKL